MAQVINNPPSWVGKIPWRRKWQSTPIFLAGESHGKRGLASCSPWGGKEYRTQLKHGLGPTRLPCLWDCSGKNTGVGCRFFFQGIFQTQGSNPCLLGFLHCQQILYHLIHQGSPWSVLSMHAIISNAWFKTLVASHPATRRPRGEGFYRQKEGGARRLLAKEEKELFQAGALLLGGKGRARS